MNLDLTRIPFSRFGSYFSISYITKKIWGNNYEEGLYLRSLHGRLKKKELFLIETIDSRGNVIPSQIQASPEILLVQNDKGTAKISMPKPEFLLIEGFGTGVRFSAKGSGHFLIPVGKNEWLFNYYDEGIQISILVQHGNIKINAPWNGIKCENVILEVSPKYGKFRIILFEAAEREIINDILEHSKSCSPDVVKKEFELFLQKLPSLPSELSDHFETAGYILWSSFVKPNGYLKRPAMLMSKNWMTDIWSWDHCFNALALSYKNPELSWDQFALMFDFQSSSGALPDFVNDHESYWNFSKPPVHGWTIEKLLTNLPSNFSLEIEDIYLFLEKWTSWWLNYRDYDKDGIPQYNHGNDSGWDNSTVFLERPPIESPDLSAFLIKQMEVLSKLAEKIGRDDLTIKWKEDASRFLGKLLNHSLRGCELMPMTSGSHKVIESMSLLPMISIVIGDKLPGKVLGKMIQRIKKFMTPYGLSTEEPDSPFYTSDGYWRGPVWAPVVMIIVDSLERIGQHHLAQQISSRFVKLVAKEGFAENFDALNGKALRDPAHTWTASVFLILAKDLDRGREKSC